MVLRRPIGQALWCERRFAGGSAMGTYACCMFQSPAVAKWLMKGVATVTICWKFDQRKSSKEILTTCQNFMKCLVMMLHLQVVTYSELPGWGQAGRRSIRAGIMRTFYDPCEQVFLQQLLMDLMKHGQSEACIDAKSPGERCYLSEK